MGKYVYRPLQVEAHKIIDVKMGEHSWGCDIRVEGDPEGLVRMVTNDMLARMTPVVGDYLVIQQDGYEYLNPKDVFEKKFVPFEEHFKNVSIPDKLTQTDIDQIVSSSTIEDMKLEPKTTLVKLTLPNGFEIIETSSCVSPENYDHEMGKQICMERVINKIWMLEGYVLSSKRAGLI